MLFQVKFGEFTVMSGLPWGQATQIAAIVGGKATVSRDRGGHVYFAGREWDTFKEIAPGVVMGDDTRLYTLTDDRRVGNGIIRLGDNEFAQELIH